MEPQPFFHPKKKIRNIKHQSISVSIAWCNCLFFCVAFLKALNEVVEFSRNTSRAFFHKGPLKASSSIRVSQASPGFHPIIGNLQIVFPYFLLKIDFFIPQDLITNCHQLQLNMVCFCYARYWDGFMGGFVFAKLNHETFGYIRSMQPMWCESCDPTSLYVDGFVFVHFCLEKMHGNSSVIYNNLWFCIEPGI